MFIAISSLLRQCRHGSVRQQLTGAALLPAAECLYTDLSVSDRPDDVSSSVRALSSTATSTSSPLFQSSRDTVQSLGLRARHASTMSESHTARRREILRDAAQKVSPGSTWLLAYSHNIDPRQLTYRLGKRSTLHALEEGWALYQQKFDTVAMAALLRRVRVAQLYDTDFDTAAAQRLLNALEPRLRSITMRFGKLRDTTAYLHALAKLRSPPPQAPAPGIAGLLESSNDDSSVADSPSANDRMRLGQPPELVLDLAIWASRDRVHMLNASPRRLSTLLWALLRTVPLELYGSEKLQMVLDRVALCSIRQLPNFSAQDMRVYATAYATFGPRGVPAVASPSGPDGSWSRNGRSWLGSVSSWPKPVKNPKAEGSNGGDDSGSTEPSAGVADPRRGEEKMVQRRKRNALILQAMADQLVKRVGDVTVTQPQTRDLALVAYAWALQGAPTPHMPLLVKAADAAAAAPRSLLPMELVLLVESLAKFGVRHPLLMNTARQCARDWAGTDAVSGTGAAGVSEARKGQLQQLYGQLAEAFRSLGVNL
ncbi:hypothetical protein Vretimale_17276 [Volvox reticuliferus]|uniref:Uncharacterized protein n=1 Tax=Volvox reticuliferus TaxID=1737510 RepID=A0A8J4GSM3_9CHLO|nr:hypothetical protein Vretimale_17276 [Volvox reticuliferus]